MTNVCLLCVGILSRVMEIGNVKYGRDNWTGLGVATERMYADAAVRHLARIQSGELLDESGLPHWGHVMACSMIALHHASGHGSIWPSP